MFYLHYTFYLKLKDIYSIFFNRIINNKENVHSEFVDRYKSLLTSSNPSLESSLNDFIKCWANYAKYFGFINAQNRELYPGIIPSTSEAHRWLTSIIDLYKIINL